MKAFRLDFCPTTGDGPCFAQCLDPNAATHEHSGTALFYEEGAPVRLLAYPRRGWRFDHWIGEDIEGLKTNEVVVSMNRDRIAIPVFVPEDARGRISGVYVTAEVSGGPTIPDRSDGDTAYSGGSVPFFPAGIADWGRPDLFPDSIHYQSTYERGDRPLPYPRAFHLFHQYIARDLLRVSEDVRWERVKSQYYSGETHPFEVHLMAQLVAPELGVSEEVKDQVHWRILPGSPRGALIAPTLEHPLHATVSGMERPGLYRFLVETKKGAWDRSAVLREQLGESYSSDEDPDVEYWAVSQVLIPAAGADMTRWLFDEMNRMLLNYPARSEGLAPSVPE